MKVEMVGGQDAISTSLSILIPILIGRGDTGWGYTRVYAW